MNSTVYASILRTPPTDCAYTRKVDVCPCARLIENTTSIGGEIRAVVELHALAQVEHQVVGLVRFQLVASHGTSSSFLSKSPGSRNVAVERVVDELVLPVQDRRSRWSFTIDQRSVFASGGARAASRTSAAYRSFHWRHCVHPAGPIFKITICDV